MNSRLRLAATLAIGLAGAGPVTAQVITGTGPPGTPAWSGSIGSPGATPGSGGSRFGRGSLIGDGMGGFTIYQGRNRSRYLGPPRGPGTVHHPGPGTSSVLDGGRGGAVVTGPGGVHRHWTWPDDLSDLRR